MEKQRCPWANVPLAIVYHDTEWGKPEHDDRKLFELLILEGMQAGLSWNTILAKRENFQRAFDNFRPEYVSTYGEVKIEELMNNPGIIRNQRKIHAAIRNAEKFLEIQREYGTFDKYIWSFVEGKQIVNAWEDQTQMPATSEVSERMSKALKRKGFQFVGATICYSYMQAIGMINDHMIWCCEYQHCKE